ncbi:MAG: 4Fe-4S binding protein [Spirochaetaceae bacterium]|nr:4Fe-4S binding protein [Spirochaetaceae bacterium]
MSKKLAVTDKSACMTCLTCELACAQAFYKNTDIRLSCIQIGEKSGKTQISFCVQCGKCAKACEQGAIAENKNGVFMLDKKKCVDCGKCVEACPFQVIVKAEGAASPSKCIACGICVRACPAEVLYIKEAS